MPRWRCVVLAFLPVLFLLWPAAPANAYTRPEQRSGTWELPRPSFPPPATERGRSVSDEAPMHIPDPEEEVWFWTRDFRRRSIERLKAYLAGFDDCSVIYVEEGRHLDPDLVNSMLKEISGNILPTVRRFFGREPWPGISGDGRITIFVYDIQDDFDETGLYYAGYFSAEDLYPSSTARYSNEREMLYVDYYPGLTGGQMEDVYGVIAHEYQHLVHFYADPNEVKWVDEGCANLATYICGYGEPYQHSRAFQTSPGTSLIEWDGTLEDYGAAFLFMKYIYEKYDRGSGLLRRIVSETRNCRAGIEAALQVVSFDKAFANWTIANVLDVYAREDLFMYNDLSVKCRPRASVMEWPMNPATEDIMPYGTHYYRFTRGQGNSIGINVQSHEHLPLLVQLLAYEDGNGTMISRETLALNAETNLDLSELDISWEWAMVSLSAMSERGASYSISSRLDGPLIRLVPNPILPSNVIVLARAESIESATYVNEDNPSEVYSISMKQVRDQVYLGSFDPETAGRYAITLTGTGSEGDRGRSRAIAVITSLIPGRYMKWGRDL